MDPDKIVKLLDLIDKAKVPPPGEDVIDDRAKAIISKAEADIDAEIAV